MENLSSVDPQIFSAIAKETERERNTIELIASENFASRAVLEAQGSVFTNKYAEGYPEKRYYGGCEYADEVETLAIQRARQLFDAEHVNVQPHSGSSANMAVYQAALKVDDTIMGMNLSHGGHLTHGSPVNFSGTLYKIVSYGVQEETELIDYNRLRDIAKEVCPKMIVAGASAYPRFIDFAIFQEIAEEVGAKLLVDMAHIAGLVAAGIHPSPVPHADYVTTTTHKTLRGPRGGMIICRQKFARKVDKKIFPGIQGGPLVHVIAAKAVALHEALQPEFTEYQKQVVANAKALAEKLQQRGFRLVTGGTDNHLLLMDLRSHKLSGKDAEHALERASITVNKNMIPFDPQSPLITSGIRLGTPAMTTRNMKETEMQLIGDMIADVLENIRSESVQNSVQQKVKELCRQFPLSY